MFSRLGDLAQKAKWSKILWRSRIQTLPTILNNLCWKWLGSLSAMLATLLIANALLQGGSLDARCFQLDPLPSSAKFYFLVHYLLSNHKQFTNSFSRYLFIDIHILPQWKVTKAKSLLLHNLLSQNKIEWRYNEKTARRHNTSHNQSWQSCMHGAKYEMKYISDTQLFLEIRNLCSNHRSHWKDGQESHW